MGRRIISVLLTLGTLYILSCDLTNPMDEVIRQAEEDAVQGERPRISLFEIPGNPTTTPPSASISRQATM